MTAPSTTTQGDIDAIMELAAPTTPADDSSTPTDAQSTDAPDQSDAGAESPDLYPNVLRTFKVGVDAPENGENPAETLTVSEFAGYLTVENFKAGNMTADSIVKDANIYTGVKAKRQALPVVLVFPADSDEQRDAKVYLPVAEAVEAYRSRPERGTSNTGTSKRTQDEITTDGAKKLLALRAAEARLAKVTDQYKKVAEQMDKYRNWLRPFHKDAENPADAVNEAFELRAKELEVEAGAAKNADISDAPATETDAA